MLKNRVFKKSYIYTTKKDAMTKDLIKKKIDSLPPDKVDAVGEFIDFILYKCNEETVTEQLVKLQAESGAFDFLNDEPDLYSNKNLIEKYQ